MAAERVLNLDDPQGALWASEFPTAIGYGVEREAAVRAAHVVLDPAGSRFEVNGVPIGIALPGMFNVANALAALAAARALGVDERRAAAGLATLDVVPGRMERVADDEVGVFVDYAHTPDALARCLNAIRDITHGTLTVVFGCGGDRDRGKRPVMGRIAAELADRVIVTSDNPRGEQPNAIIAEIVAGIDRATRERRTDVIPAREEAIRHAIVAARRGDSVLIAGKGHETYQISGDQVIHFDDREVARDALAARVGAHS